MVTRISLVIGGFAVIAAVTLLQCVEGGNGNVFLAGENTPVWTARCHNPPCDNKNNPPTYKRLGNDVIKRAFVYFHSKKFKSVSSHLKRTARDVHATQEKKAEIKEYVARAYTECELKLPVGNGTRSLRSILNRRQFGTVEASVLAVMNYDASAVKDDASRRKYVKENILYTLAYWNFFNNKVWEIKGIRDRPHVQVKLVGIIIALDRNATPYVNSSINAQECLQKANTFWRNPPSPDQFPRNSYHAVATMTDVAPKNDYGNFEVVVKSNNGNSPSIIVWDSPNFLILKQKAKVYYQQVGDKLREWADRFPKVYDHMKPGNPVEAILPGQLVTLEDQCRAADYKYLERTCPEYSTDCKLYCLNDGFLKSCRAIPTTLDGTPCKDGKVENP